MHTTSGSLAQQHVDTEQLNQRLDALLAVKRKVQAMAPQNEKKNAIKNHKPHQWWYLNPQYYADNPPHNIRIPPYASHECKLRPSHTLASGNLAGVPTGKTYEQLKRELVAKSRNGHRNRARRAFKKMWTVTGNMWRDSHSQTLALIRKQEGWTRRQLQAQEREQAYLAWLEERQQQHAAVPTGQGKKPTLIERLLRTTSQPQQASAEVEQVTGAAPAPAASAPVEVQQRTDVPAHEQQQQQQQQQQGQQQGQQPAV
jgi:hypothetical protein